MRIQNKNRVGYYLPDDSDIHRTCDQCNRPMPDGIQHLKVPTFKGCTIVLTTAVCINGVPCRTQDGKPILHVEVL